MEHITHLRVDATKCSIVTISIQRIGTVGGFLIAVDGAGRLAEVAIDAAEEIVGTHALVGSAVAVVEATGFKEQRVGGHGHIVTVHRVGLGNDLRHLLPLALSGASAAQREHQNEEEYR